MSSYQKSGVFSLAHFHKTRAVRKINFSSGSFLECTLRWMHSTVSEILIMRNVYFATFLDADNEFLRPVVLDIF